MEKVKRSGDSVVIWCSLAMAVMVVFVLLAAAFKGGVYLAAWILIPFFFICVIAYGLVFWYKVVSNSVAARNWPMLTVQIVVTIIAAPFLLVFLLGINGLRLWNGCQILYTYIIRYAREVILIHESKFLGESEKNGLENGLYRSNRHSMFSCVFNGSTCKQTGECTILQIQLVEHQPQLFTILRHVVSLSADKQVTAITNLIDVLSRKFCHFGRTTCSKYLLTHKLTGIDACGTGCRYELR